MNYQKVWCKLWDDEKFRELSDAAKVVFLNLLINKNGNLIGLFVLRLGYIMEDTTKKESEINKALEEIVGSGFVLYDKKTALLCIKNYLKYYPIPTNDKITAARKIIEQLPKSQLMSEFRTQLIREEISSHDKNSLLIPIVDDVLRGMGFTVQDPPPQENRPEPSENKTKKINLNIEGLVDIWNQTCVPILTRVLSIHPGRETAIRARLTERPDLEEWKGIFKGITQSPFLIGENDRGWKCDFDWVMKPGNLARIMEGKWLNSGSKEKRSTPQSSLWGKCKKCLKEALLANLNEAGLCLNCNPEAENQTQRLKELMASIGKTLPKEPHSISSNTEQTE